MGRTRLDFVMSLSGAVLALVAITAGCGGDSFENGGGSGGAAGAGTQSGTTGSGTTGSGTTGSGTTGSGTTGSGTTGSGTTGSGGSTSGGSGGGGGYQPPDQSCEDVSDCVAVVDTGDPCYASGCAVPIAVSRSALAKDPCLVEYRDGTETRPDDCEPRGDPTIILCPLACALPPSCVELDCSAGGQCELEPIYDPASCESGGSGGGPIPGECESLEADLLEAFTAATACSPALTVEQCSVDVTVFDTCGCTVPANLDDEGAASRARAAYQEWVAAECGPYLCIVECMEGTAATCSPVGDAGRCTYTAAF
jgi:hypothetical protein